MVPERGLVGEEVAGAADGLECGPFLGGFWHEDQFTW
jgi:hypothetical protein